MKTVLSICIVVFIASFLLGVLLLCNKDENTSITNAFGNVLQKFELDDDRPVPNDVSPYRYKPSPPAGFGDVEKLMPTGSFPNALPVDDPQTALDKHLNHPRMSQLQYNTATRLHGIRYQPDVDPSRNTWNILQSSAALDRQAGIDAPVVETGYSSSTKWL